MPDVAHGRFHRKLAFPLNVTVILYQRPKYNVEQASFCAERPCTCGPDHGLNDARTRASMFSQAGKALRLLPWQRRCFVLSLVSIVTPDAGAGASASASASARDDGHGKSGSETIDGTRCILIEVIWPVNKSQAGLGLGKDA